jgi:DNA repair photolyase
MVLRDLDILKRASNVEVGFSITTADDKIRKLFEPGAPTIPKRIDALMMLHKEGIRTFVMVAPLLPYAETLADILKGHVDHALIDRYNYYYANKVYRKNGLEWAMTDEYFNEKGEELRAAFEKAGVPCEKLY